MYPIWVHFSFYLSYTIYDMKFAPLHIVTGYSFLQSGLRMEDMGRIIKSHDYFGSGITDIGAMYGVPHFVKEMDSIKKPYLIGEEVIINGDHLSLFVISEEGYKNLIKINLENQLGDLTFSFLNEHKDGLIAVLETVRGTFKEKFDDNITSEFKKYLLEFAKIYQDNFYLGIEVTSKAGITYANKIRKFANEFTYHTIAFPLIRYEKKEDAITVLMTNAIAQDEVINIKALSGQEYFMSVENYMKIYTKIEMENTVKVVSSSTFDFHKKRGEIIHYPVENAEQYLKDYCFNRLKELHLDDQKHTKKLSHELSIISQMGYNDYFLIVYDLVNYAKNHDILVGPGRGSAAGSLVAHLLNITEIDPLDYDLQFERFLNPYRKSMPDIDIDFMDIRRNDMVEYMKQRWGEDKVANIIAIQTIGAKQALRDVGRIYNYPTHHIDLLSKKLIEKDLSLRDSYRHLPDFRQLIDNDKYFLEIVSLAKKIEGLPRQTGLHAAGVVIDNNALIESVPLTSTFSNLICQYEKDYLEEQGLLKMDLLSISNLTIVYDAIELINYNHPGLNLDPYHIPFNEKEVFDLIRNNKTLGLFQIDTPVMRRSISMLHPSNFDDIVALLALGRPGPMKYIPSYAKRKEGKEKYSFISSDLKDILAPTYGIIVYQEQINSIATKMAGFSLGEADNFRRAISKKDKDKILALEKTFIEGSINNGYSEKDSKKTFADILEFAEYGFNKSHSVVYAMLACRMAYLKVHYPLEFYTALFGTSAASSDEKFNAYISEMNSLGVKMLPPHINYSKNNFVIKDGCLLFPLTGIKGITYTIYEKIEEERKANGPFKNFFDFCLRIFPKKLSDEQIDNLISSGAFDEFYPSRESMRMTIRSAMQYAELNYREDGQLSIGIDFVAPPRMNDTKDNPIENLNKEYEVIGAMLSNNPLTYQKDKLINLGVKPINEGKELDTFLIAGIISSKKVITTKKGTSMAFVHLFDQSDDIEVTIFPELYKEKIHLINKNAIVVMKIKRQFSRNEEVNYIADEISEVND